MGNFNTDTSVAFHKHTKLAFSLYRLLESPLGSLFNIFAFILYTRLHATPLQITILVSSKPMVALLSFYGNLFIKDKSSQLKLMILVSVLLGSVLCFLFPFTNNIWFMIAAHALFMLSLRAVAPAWSEILRINLPSERRNRVFSRGSVVNYLTNIVVPLLVSPLLDGYPDSWKWLFFAFAALNCLNIIVLLKLELKSYPPEMDPAAPYRFDSLSSILIAPWKSGYKLIKERADFKYFQIVFMLCGSGIMMIHPALPVFLEGTLHLSYFKLALATSFCKGIGFVLSSSFWANLLNRISINLFNFYLCCFAAIFTLLLIGAQQVVISVYIAYLTYGIMQAGSELSWNLAGPIFARNKDSTLYTGINVAAIGIRGCVAPFIGSLLFLKTNSMIALFACGGGLCIMASFYSLWLSTQTKKALPPQV